MLGSHGKRTRQEFSQVSRRHKELMASVSWQKSTITCATATKGEGTLERPRAGTGLQGKDVILEYYRRYNAGDVDGVMELMAPDCQYHDMIYLEPFQGHKEIRQYFEKVVSIVPSDLKFTVEDITDGDMRKVGVKWHVEVAGNEFPFSRGASFYELNSEGQIVYGRDLVEPALKPGSSALLGLKVLAPLVRKLGPNANPAKLKDVPINSLLIWAFYTGYMSFIFASSSLPGVPVWQTPPEVINEVLLSSINFFYVNSGLTALGLSFIPDIPVHPVTLGLFNFVNAWSMMLWPLMLADKKGAAVKNRFPLYLGTQFLTNVFFIPYMALREADGGKPNRAYNGCNPAALPSYAPALGVVAAIVGIVTFFWVPLALPQYGGLADRWEFFLEAYNLNRAFFAFVLDAGLYTIFQAVLLRSAPPAYRFTPFFGLAAWLVRQETESERR